MLLAIALQALALAWAASSATWQAYLQGASIVLLLAVSLLVARQGWREIKPPTVSLGDAAENAEAIFTIKNGPKREKLLEDVYAMRRCILQFTSNGHINPDVLARGLEASCSAIVKLKGDRSK